MSPSRKPRHEGRKFGALDKGKISSNPNTPTKHATSGEVHPITSDSPATNRGQFSKKSPRKGKHRRSRYVLVSKSSEPPTPKSRRRRNHALTWNEYEFMLNMTNLIMERH